MHGVRPRLVATTMPLALLGLLLGLLAGCAEPTLLDEDEDADAAPAAPAEAVPDPDREALVEQLAELVASTTAARDLLLEAATADDLATARQRGDAAVDQLLAAGGPDLPAVPLLPAETPDRGASPLQRDVLTATLTAAREAGGTLGDRVTAVLRDPVAGDLGAWSRDAAGVVAQVRAVADPTTPLEALDAAVLELNGDALRALAWALLTADAPDADLARAYAERGAVHLDLILEAVEREIGPAVEVGEDADDLGTSDADADADPDQDEDAEADA
jgi:hypothetical protein